MIRFVVSSPESHVRSEHSSEMAAMLAALGRLSVSQPEVTVQGFTGDAPTTFGVRRLVLSDGNIVDRGWRCWVSGRFIGVRDRFEDVVRFGVRGWAVNEALAS